MTTILSYCILITVYNSIREFFLPLFFLYIYNAKVKHIFSRSNISDSRCTMTRPRYNEWNEREETVLISYVISIAS